jgi:putative Holliday junction resolvase
MSRILGLDVGQARIGVAVSDPWGMTAQGLDVISLEDEEEALMRIKALVEERGVSKVVVGLPRNMDGSLGSQAQWTMEFAEKLRERVPVPVEMWDERLTTVWAERILIGAGVRRRKRRDVVDQVAAAILLQSYLDACTSSACST